MTIVKTTVGPQLNFPRLPRVFRPKFTHLIKSCTLIVFLIGIAACAPVQEPPIIAEPVETAPEPKFSSEPIKKARRNQIMFAQTALKKLGYRIGKIDGIWGPRSAAAIRKFEAEKELVGAEGFLSELNLNELATDSGLDPSTYVVQPKRPTGISSKLKGNLQRSGPQLIIVENTYKVFSDANPFSEMIFELQPGTGIYVLSSLEDWYQIESINRKKGYIQAD